MRRLTLRIVLHALLLSQVVMVIVMFALAQRLRITVVASMSRLLTRRWRILSKMKLTLLQNKVSLYFTWLEEVVC